MRIIFISKNILFGIYNIHSIRVCVHKKMIESISKIRVRFGETDGMGIAYHGNYFHWFEVARIDLLDHIGVTYKSLEKEGYILPVLEAQAKYHRSAFFDDRLIITAQIQPFSRLKLSIHYQIKSSNTLICQGKTLHAFLDSKSHKPTKPPKRFLDALAKKGIISSHQPDSHD